MSTAQTNINLFNQLQGIYNQIPGQSMPARPSWASGGGGRYTSWLQTEINTANQRLADYNAQKQREANAAAMQAAVAPLLSSLTSARAAQQVPKQEARVLKTTGDAGVRGRKSRQLKMQEKKGVRESNTLQSRGYLSPTTGGVTSTPFGSFINLA